MPDSMAGIRGSVALEVVGDTFATMYNTGKRLGATFFGCSPDDERLQVTVITSYPHIIAVDGTVTQYKGTVHLSYYIPAEDDDAEPVRPAGSSRPAVPSVTWLGGSVDDDDDE